MPFLGAAVKPASQGSLHAGALFCSRRQAYLTVWSRDANYCVSAIGCLFTLSASQVPRPGGSPPCTRHTSPLPVTPPTAPASVGRRQLGSSCSLSSLLSRGQGLSSKSLTREKSWAGRQIEITLHLPLGFTPELF